MESYLKARVINERFPRDIDHDMVVPRSFFDSISWMGKRCGVFKFIPDDIVASQPIDRLGVKQSRPVFCTDMEVSIMSALHRRFIAKFANHADAPIEQDIGRCDYVLPTYLLDLNLTDFVKIMPDAELQLEALLVAAKLLKMSGHFELVRYTGVSLRKDGHVQTNIERLCLIKNQSVAQTMECTEDPDSVPDFVDLSRLHNNFFERVWQFILFMHKHQQNPHFGKNVPSFEEEMRFLLLRADFIGKRMLVGPRMLSVSWPGVLCRPVIMPYTLYTAIQTGCCIGSEHMHVSAFIAIASMLEDDWAQPFSSSRMKFTYQWMRMGSKAMRVAYHTSVDDIVEEHKPMTAMLPLIRQHKGTDQLIQLLQAAVLDAGAKIVVLDGAKKTVVGISPGVGTRKSVDLAIPAELLECLEDKTRVNKSGGIVLNASVPDAVASYDTAEDAVQLVGRALKMSIMDKNVPDLTPAGMAFMREVKRMAEVDVQPPSPKRLARCVSEGQGQAVIFCSTTSVPSGVTNVREHLSVDKVQAVLL